MNESPLDNLSKGLIEVYEKIKPNAATHKQRKAVVKRIRKIIKKTFISSEVHVFGSFKTGLYLPSSDIDLVVLVNSDTLKVLSTLKSLLISQGITQNNLCLLVKRAKVPVLKFTDTTFGFKFDVTVNNTNGIDAVEFIKATIEARPYLKVFFLLLKQFMNLRGLGDASNGGLNSYSQFLLLLNFFQLHPFMQCNAIDPYENLGVLFLEFLQFYAFDFQFSNVTICVENVQYKRNWVGRCCIVDPTDKETNTASNCREIRMILKALQYAYRKMVYSIKKFKRGDELARGWFK